MNVLDSEMVVASLRRQGYDLAQTVDEADTILFILAVFGNMPKRRSTTTFITLKR